MPHRSRIARSLALVATIGTLLAIVGGPLASAGAAVPDGGRDAPAVVATLKIENPSVAVKKKDADDFKTAKEGQRLRAGDTIQTDGTGKAEISYADDSYTRLDVDTTFTIEKLSDEQGNRQVEGSLESGKAWHRTAALTESETFEQSGAGATAAVVGTAFGMICTSASQCDVFGAEGSFEWTGSNAIHLIGPLDTCGSTTAIVCLDISHLTPEQLPQWILENIVKDLLLGYTFPFSFSGTVIVENGNVFFVPSPPPSASTPPPSGTTPTVPPPPPTVPSSAPINISSPPTGDADSISTDENTSVVFTINVTSSGGQTFIKFTDLPHPSAGKLYLGNVPGATNCSLPCVNQGDEYAADSTFTFVPVDDSNTSDESTFFTFVATNEGGSSAPTTVPIDVSDNDIPVVVDSSSTEPEPIPEPAS